MFYKLSRDYVGECTYSGEFTLQDLGVKGHNVLNLLSKGSEKNNLCLEKTNDEKVNMAKVLLVNLDEGYVSDGGFFCNFHACLKLFQSKK